MEASARLAEVGVQRLGELGLAGSELGAPGALACSVAYSDFLYRILKRCGPHAGAELVARARVPLRRGALDAALESPSAPLSGSECAFALIALRELTGLMPLRASLLASTVLAERVLARALSAEAGTEGTALVVFGLGKLGGRELNFYSDLDLVFAHPDRVDEREGLERVRRVRRILARLDGGFRIDLRLRPFGQSGPLVMGLAAMETYFQDHGREWERYAWVKARAVAGERRAGRDFLGRLRPFVYRRYLDYHAFEALREMKRQIAEEAGASMRDIKRGPGGIREIEFIVQAFQLVRGGRTPSLAGPGLRGALRAAVDLALVPAEDGRTLWAAYLFLRRLENRLQAQDLTPVHLLPEDPYRRAQLAGSLGYPDWGVLERALGGHRHAVAGIFDAVFGDPAPTRRGPAERLWQTAGSAAGEADGSAAVPGLPDQERMRGELASFKSSRGVRLMSARGRVALDRVMPELLGECATTDDPGEALARLLGLLGALVRRSAYIALLAERPAALRRLVELAGRSGWIARRLAATPAVLDELLDARLAQPAPRARLAREFAAVIGLGGEPEEVSERLREINETQRLKVAAGLMDGSLTQDEAERTLTLLATLSVRTALALAAERMRVRHGGLDFELLAIGYGKLGGRELGLGSDLDLVFVYESLGERAADGLAADRYLARLAQRVISQLTLPTAAGNLYEVDTRLRPEGAAGLLISRFDAWRRYQREHAWVWERQALLRARAVAGARSIARRFGSERRTLLTQPLDAVALRAEIAAMRARVAVAGPVRTPEAEALLDGEFLAACWLLQAAPRHPRVIRGTRLGVQLEALAVAANRLEARSLAQALLVVRADLNRRVLGLPAAPGSVAARLEIGRLWEGEFGAGGAPL